MANHEEIKKLMQRMKNNDHPGSVPHSDANSGSPRQAPQFEALHNLQDELENQLVANQRLRAEQ